MAAIVIALALAAAPLGWLARRFVYRDQSRGAPSRLRRALAAAWIFVMLRRAAARRPRRAGGRARHLQPLRPERAGRHRRRVRGRARADRRQCAWPRHARAWARGLAARSDERPDGRDLLSLAMTIAAIWAVERLIEPAADAAASLNIAVAARGVGRDPRRARDRLRAAPARRRSRPARRIAAKRRLDAAQNARLGGRAGHFRRPR